MAQLGNSLTWKDTVKHAVDAYSFLIRGEGEMNGRRFAKAIRSYYSCSDERTKAILSDIEKHIVRICATWKGTKYYTI